MKVIDILDPTGPTALASGEAAHGVARPAAPVSTFILGYAAAARGLDAADIAQLAAELGRAARGD